jgi:hypothetical protein
VLISRAVSRQFSRREFLKLTSIGVGALVLLSPRRGIAEGVVASRGDEFRAWGQDSFTLASLMRPYQALSDWPVTPPEQMPSNPADRKGSS